MLMARFSFSSFLGEGEVRWFLIVRLVVGIAVMDGAYRNAFCRVFLFLLEMAGG